MHYDPAAAAIGLRAAIAVLAAVSVVHFIVLPTLVAGFRQRIFESRRRLFICMTEGHIPADHPAYTGLRRSMNNLIRFAERVTFTRTVLAGLSFRESGSRQSQSLEQAIRGIEDEDVRDRLMAFRMEITREILRHLILTSPAVWALVVMLAIGAIGQALVRGVSKARSGATKAIHRLVIQQLRQRMPLESLQAEADLFSECSPA